ncbi:uncharacterized protein METZ01_LOCUS361437 [marine metagenome]|uniref:Uncharacterized protein n=1 Tax=marine metagenome TaxID=408172 RepID=A0A382SFF8_9ZZZZ
MRGIRLGEMKKFRKMKKDIDKGFPAFGKLLDDTIENTPTKIERLIKKATNGFEKLFSSE